MKALQSREVVTNFEDVVVRKEAEGEEFNKEHKKMLQMETRLGEMEQ